MREFEIIRSNRRTMALQVRGDRVIVRVPRRTPESRIREFVASNEEWIKSALAKEQQRCAVHPEPTEAQREAYIQRAKAILPERVAYYSGIMGLYPTQIRISNAETRFGSCSSTGRISFSWRLMQYPPEAIDYVVVHELAHLRHMNHGKEFYALVASVLPDHKERRALLRK